MNNQPLDYGVQQDANVNPFENLEATTTGRRFGNFIIDTICHYIIIIIVSLIVILPMAMNNPEDGINTESPMFTLISYLIAFGVIIGYYWFFEYVCKGRTIGKFITGTRAIMLGGDRLTSKAAFLRSVSRLVPFEPFSFLGSNSGWHDQWTDSYVVNEREYQDALSKSEFKGTI
jgi:uncharacterized RDD family membrane protein YckC